MDGAVSVKAVIHHRVDDAVVSGIDVHPANLAVGVVKIGVNVVHGAVVLVIDFQFVQPTVIIEGIIIDQIDRTVIAVIDLDFIDRKARRGPVVKGFFVAFRNEHEDTGLNRQRGKPQAGHGKNSGQKISCF